VKEGAAAARRGAGAPAVPRKRVLTPLVRLLVVLGFELAAQAALLPALLGKLLRKRPDQPHLLGVDSIVENPHHASPFRLNPSAGIPPTAFRLQNGVRPSFFKAREGKRRLGKSVERGRFE
jgi:hypothetical protein